MIEAAPYLIKPWVSAQGCSMQGLVMMVVIVWVWIFKRDWELKKPLIRRDYFTVYVKKLMTKLRGLMRK